MYTKRNKSKFYQFFNLKKMEYFEGPMDGFG